jgi:hypothetical protein
MSDDEKNMDAPPGLNPGEARKVIERARELGSLTDALSEDGGLKDGVGFTGIQTIKDIPTGDFRETDPEQMDSYVEVPVDESNLVAHARRELEILGEDDETVQGYLKVIQAFADMGHSGGSASVAIPVIHDLLQFKALTPLTNDPEEWMHIAEEQAGQKNLWLSVRQPDAFSNDGGKTHYLVSDRHRTVRKTQAK